MPDKPAERESMKLNKGITFDGRSFQGAYRFIADVKDPLTNNSEGTTTKRISIFAASESEAFADANEHFSKWEVVNEQS